MIDPVSGGYNQPRHINNYGVRQAGGINGTGELHSNRAHSVETANARKADAVQKSECETCKNRKYQDVSDDPGVSFKTPTRISPAAAESLVRAHEGEHVANAQSEAAQKGGRAISTVSIHYSSCPE